MTTSENQEDILFFNLTFLKFVLSYFLNEVLSHCLGYLDRSFLILMYIWTSEARYVFAWLVKGLDWLNVATGLAKLRGGSHRAHPGRCGR